MIPLDKDILAAATAYAEALYGDHDLLNEDLQELRKNKQMAVTAFCAGARWQIIDHLRKNEFNMIR